MLQRYCHQCKISIVGLFPRQAHHIVQEKKYFSNLAILFHVEVQLRHLQSVLPRFGLVGESFTAVFPKNTAQVVEVGERGYKLTNNGITCYDTSYNRVGRFEYRLFKD